MRDGHYRDLIAAFQAGVQAAAPDVALDRALDERPVATPKGKRVILAVGKAAVPMARVAARRLKPFHNLILVTNPENATQVEDAELFAANHPVPDAVGLAASARVIQSVRGLGASDQVLVLLSGGASALLPAPKDGLTLADKMAVNDVLLSSGLDITAMNLVRQSLSSLKGGGLLALAQPADVRSFILSDVLGDDLRVVGSGPSIGPVGSPSQARALLKEKDLWSRLPVAAQEVLEAAKETPFALKPDAMLIGSNGQSLLAMAQAVDATVSPVPLEGDVEQAAIRVVQEARDLAPEAVRAFGGETTVVLTGAGRGGRNQELALRVVRQAKAQGLSGNWTFLSGGTDGRDGPTDAAGAIVDQNTLAQMTAAGIDLDAVLADNDSYPALAAIGALLMTGGTGTNVADLQLMRRA
ncbi:MAG: DUF4147 domain-containing protein [Pseudomonadota bacterium]